MKVFTPKVINECPDCQFTTASYNDFLEHRVKCLRERLLPPAELDWDLVGRACVAVYQGTRAEFLKAETGA